MEKKKELKRDQIVIGKGIKTLYRGWIKEIKEIQTPNEKDCLITLQVFEKEDTNVSVPVKQRVFQEKVIPISNIHEIEDFTFKQLPVIEQLNLSVLFGDEQWFNELTQ